MSRLFSKYRVVALVLFASLAACSGGDAGPEVTANEPQAVTPAPVVPGSWVVMGSSTAAGSGASPGKSWVALMQANTAQVQVSNLAVGGSTSYSGLSLNTATTPGRPAPDAVHNIDAALAFQPRLLLVSYPGNDTALGYSVDETVRNLLSIRSTALAAGTAVMVLSTQPRRLSPQQLASLAQIDQRLSAALGPCFVAVRESLAGSDGGLAPANDSGDGVHPSDEGHALIWQSVSARLLDEQCVRLK